MRITATLAILLACTAPARAETQLREEPAIGEMRTAPIGSVIWELHEFESTTGVIIEDAVRANWARAERVDLPAGSGLVILREKRLKACRTVTRLRNIGATIWSDCLFDLDEDGNFERVSYNSAGSSKPLDPPVAYRKGTIELVGEAAPPSTTKALVYLGSDGRSLELKYSEFYSDNARPTVSQELTIPLGDSFPQDVAVRDRVITIFGIDGMGLRYAIKK